MHFLCTTPLAAPKHPCYRPLVFRRSSAVEQLTVNQLVVGSIPTAGAKISNEISYLQEARLGGFFAFLVLVT